MTAAARAFLLGCVVATAACSASTAEEPVVAGDTADLTGGSIAAGIERQRAGDGSGTVAAVQQRTVHFGNAQVLASISSAAYGDGSTPASLAAAGVAGITSVTAFDNHCTGGYAMYLEAPSFSVLAFRGTLLNSPIDIAIDADDAFHDYPFTQGGQRARVHDGFWQQFNSLWNASATCGVTQGIGAFLAARTAQTPLYFTGHSLGGALAQLAVAQTFVEGTSTAPTVQVAGVYTFGGPKVGNDVFAQVLGDDARATKTPMFRFVHKNDIVPTQPRPIGSLLHETWQHVKPTGEPEAAFQVWFNETTAKIGTFAVFVGYSIPDHSLDGYITDIGTNAKSRGEQP